MTESADIALEKTGIPIRHQEIQKAPSSTIAHIPENIIIKRSTTVITAKAPTRESFKIR